MVAVRVDAKAALDKYAKLETPSLTIDTESYVPRHGAQYKIGDHVLVSNGPRKGEYHQVSTATLKGTPLSWYYDMVDETMKDVPEGYLDFDQRDCDSCDGE